MIVVDRIEGELAVLELDGQSVTVPVALLPPGTREGDVLRLVVDPDATHAQHTDAERRLERLRARSTQGPGTFDL